MGCILYELCALKVPFDATNLSGLVGKICRGAVAGDGGGQWVAHVMRWLCHEQGGNAMRYVQEHSIIAST